MMMIIIIIIFNFIDILFPEPLTSANAMRSKSEMDLKAKAPFNLYTTPSVQNFNAYQPHYKRPPTIIKVDNSTNDGESEGGFFAQLRKLDDGVSSGQLSARRY